MDSIKAQDIIRHIFKDEDKGVAYRSADRHVDM